MILAVLLLAAIHTPEECLVTSGVAVVTVEHAGKSYNLRHADCGEEFAKDPERYSQLYDALLELHAQGAVIKSAPPLLVPS